MEKISLTKIIIVITVALLLIIATGFYYYFSLPQSQENSPAELILLENGEPDPNQTGFIEVNLSPEAYERFMDLIASQPSTTVTEKITPASEE